MTVFDLQGINIYLIGMMGSGKSTTGTLLAQRLEYKFIDTDVSIEKVAHQTIPEIFETAGETDFREIETQVLAEVSAYTRLVVATGGGISIKLENWNHLQQGLVIWLDVSIDVIVGRLKEDTKNIRPIILNTPPEELHSKLDTILSERRDRYAAADLRMPIESDLSPSEIVERILSAIPSVLKVKV